MIEDLKLFLKNTLSNKEIELNNLLSSNHYSLILVNRLDSDIELLDIILSYIYYLQENNFGGNNK